jgi:hypothetical protein
MRRFFRLCKCATGAFFLLKRKHSGRYFPQAHLGYVAGRKAEGVHRAAGIKICNLPEVR